MQNKSGLERVAQRLSGFSNLQRGMFRVRNGTSKATDFVNLLKGLKQAADLVKLVTRFN